MIALEMEPKKISMKIKCKTCKEKYRVTRKKNIKIKKAVEFVSLETKREQGFLFANHKNRNIFEKVIEYFAICPNCGRKKYLCSIPTGIHIYGEWRDYGD